MDPWNILSIIITSIIIPTVAYIFQKVISQDSTISELKTKIDFHKEGLDKIKDGLDKINDKIDDINKNL